MKNEEQKNDIKFIIIFILVIACCFGYFGVSTYAKYRRGTTAKVETTIAKWKIKVNTEDIAGKSELTNVITPTIDSNSYVKSDVLAPGSTGYFDLDIDATDVDVDFNYEITSLTDVNTPKDFKINKYSLDEGTTKNDITDSKITGTIIKNTSSTKLRIYIIWDDDETSQTMNNQDDTTYAQTSTTDPSIKLQIKFTQKTS